MYDAIIIGSGPAGISSALYACRGGISVLVISSGIGELSKAKEIDNYFGTGRVSGIQLHDIGQDQIKALGVEIIEAEVTGISGFDPFEVEAGGSKFQTKTVIIATGRPRKKPKIARVDELEGRGVSYCAVCDGFFFRGKSVGVLGSGAFALSEATYLSSIVGKVTIFTNGDEIDGVIPENVDVDSRKIEGLSGESSLDGIVFENETLPISGLFVALGVASGSDFAASVGLETENGFIKINRNSETNVPGIFAAGDVAGGFLQISVAVGEGASAGQSALKFAKSKK